MKRYHKFVLFVSVSVCVFGIISSLHAAEIIFVEGSVQVQIGQQDEWRKAERGTHVAIGDKIRTARHSRADVSLDEEKKNTIRIDPKTMVVLSSANPGLIDRLDLSRGKVYAKVENIKSGLSFEVKTPSAVAGVRGSAFSVYAERDADEIKAYKDSAFVQAYDADGNLIMEIRVPEGFKTYVERFEGPGFLSQITLRDFSRFDDMTDDIAAHEKGNMEKRRERKKARAKASGLDDAQEQSKLTEEFDTLKMQEQDNNQDDSIHDLRGDECEGEGDEHREQ